MGEEPAGDPEIGPVQLYITPDTLELLLKVIVVLVQVIVSEAEAVDISGKTVLELTEIKVEV